MKGNDKECSCETCRQREKLELEFPDKEIGLQYAVWDLEKFRLIVSAEELPYLQEELKDKPLERLNEENVQYILAYGVFKSQTEFHEDFFDLKLSKMGTYFYFDREKEHEKQIESHQFKEEPEQSSEQEDKQEPPQHKPFTPKL